MRRGNRGLPTHEDPGFFRSDFFDGISKLLHVIHADGRDHADIRWDCGGRIEPPAHAGFEHDDLALAEAEPAHRQHQRDFKKRRMRFHPLAQSPQLGEHRGAGLLGDFLAAHWDPLAEVDEMRRGE